MSKKFVFSLIAITIGLVMAEIVARIVEPDQLGPGVQDSRSGWQAEFFSTLFDWHEPDPDLLWRFRPNLNVGYITTNRSHLIGEEFSQEKPANVFRILLLGDSSPVGLGLSSYRQSFGALLRGLLSDDLQRPVEVVNAAVAGYTSEQVLRFLEVRGWSYDPDLVLLYCGNNDASVSGYLSDQELIEKQRFKTLRRFAAKSALYRLLRSLIESTRPVDQPQLNDRPLVVRVTPDRFGHNLGIIAGQCVDRGCPLVIMRPAVPLLWPAGLQFKVFQTVTGRGGSLILPEPMRRVLGRPMKYCFDWEDIADRYGDGDPFTRSVYRSAYTDLLEPQKAIRHYIEQITTDPGDAIAANNLGVSYFERGHSDTAAQWITRGLQLYLLQTRADHDFATSAASLLDSALQMDYFSLRIKRSYTNQIDAVVSNFGEGVYVLDAAAALAANDTTPLAIEAMFIDHCHPTARGHNRLAQALRLLITERVLPNK